QTWGEAAFFELAEVPGGVTSEAALLATAFPTFVQVGPQPPPIFYVPCPQLKSFLRTESGGQTRHYAHRPLYHQPRRRLLAPAGPPLMVAVRPEQVLQVVVRPRDVRRVVAAEQPAPVTPGYLHEPPQLPGHDWVLGFGRRLADLAQQAGQPATHVLARPLPLLPQQPRHTLDPTVGGPHRRPQRRRLLQAATQQPPQLFQLFGQPPDLARHPVQARPDLLQSPHHSQPPALHLPPPPPRPP